MGISFQINLRAAAVNMEHKMVNIPIDGITLEEYAKRLQEVLYYWNYPWEIPKKKEKFKRKIQRIKRRKNERTNRNFY